MSESIEEFYLEEERKEYIEHKDALLAIRELLKSKEGVELFRYLFKSLEVATVPEMGMDDRNLHDYLGFLRAGNSIYKLACEANAEVAASILTKLEREKYDRKNREHIAKYNRV